MRVLFIGHYRESSGWGQAGRDYILALIEAGVDVVCRSVNLDRPDAQLDPRIITCEQKQSQGCDVCIQNVLPHYLSYSGHFRKNIALPMLEAHNIEYTSWYKKLAMMDEVWVCSGAEHLEKYHDLKGKIRTVHIPCDTSKYLSSLEDFDIPTMRGTFKFYFIGELNVRKRLGAMIRAFHTEFSPNEPVSLLIKSSKPGCNENQVAKELEDACNKIKFGLKLYPELSQYHPEIFITRYLSDIDMLRVHHTCDCLINTSFGEAWGISSMDSLAMGNQVISSLTDGAIQLKDGMTGTNVDYHTERMFLVSGREQPVIGMNDTFFDLNTAREKWTDIDVVHLQYCLRSAYEKGRRTKEHEKEGLEYVENFSYQQVGEHMRQLLSVTEKDN